MKISPDSIIPIVRQASGLFHDQTKISHIAVKGFGNFVTDADKGVQNFIREKLSALYPDVQFFAEEKENGDVDVTKDFWILDPIDGTMNLIHDFAHSAVSLGYAENGTLVFGLIYDPFRDEMFRAEKGKGAFMMQRVSQAAEEELLISNTVSTPEEAAAAGGRVWFPIHVSSAENLSQSVVAVGTAPYNRKQLGRQYGEAIYSVFMRSQDIRRFGAAVLDLAWVACGRVDGYFEHVYPWDRAAGSVIVREAGGRICSLDGSDIPVSGFHSICAGTPGVASELVSTVGPIFKT